MKKVIPVQGRLTARFDQPRPLSAASKTHAHGAVDIAAPAGSPIVAPESGKAFAFVALRPDRTVRWEEVFKVNGLDFEFGNYFYDMFGGLLVLRSDTGLVHVITHSWMNQLFNAPPFGTEPMATYEPRAESWPIAMWTYPKRVRAGEQIGSVGNAGFSTGAHVHWEIHRGQKWEPHGKRIDPEVWITA